MLLISNNTFSIMTKQEITNHYDFSGKLKLPHGYEYYTMFPGGGKLHYFLFGPDDKLIFQGDDYRPSPLYKSIDCLEAVVAGLSFLTIQEGATDNEYFEHYTPEQLEFRDSVECEEINSLINDFESIAWTAKDDEIGQDYCQAAKKYFEDNYTQLID